MELGKESERERPKTKKNVQGAVISLSCIFSRVSCLEQSSPLLGLRFGLLKLSNVIAYYSNLLDAFDPNILTYYIFNYFNRSLGEDE